MLWLLELIIDSSHHTGEDEEVSPSNVSYNTYETENVSYTLHERTIQTAWRKKKRENLKRKIDMYVITLMKIDLVDHFDSKVY